MADNRITGKRIRDHWHYSWWKYAILLALTLIGIDMLFAVTAYRPPEERRLQLFVCNGYADAAALEEDLWPALLEACPDQEELVAQNIDLVTDEYYSQIQFTTYIAAREGDVCLLPVSQLRNLTADGAEYAFLELTPYVESGVIPTQGIDLTPGMFKDSDGKEGLYAIPADGLYGLREYGCNPAGGMLTVMAYSGNSDTAATLVGQMIERFTEEPPRQEDDPARGQTRLLQ